MASRVLKEPRRPAGGKRAFANRVRGFAKPALRLPALPGFALLAVGSGSAALLMIVTGAFGTGELPLGLRSLFWALLLGWNFVKWQGWFALTVRKPEDWVRASAVGGLLLNLPLPLEIALCLKAIGVEAAPALGGTWAKALAVSVALFAFIYVVKSRLHPRSEEAAPAPPPPDGLLARARVAPELLVAIEAEDHYCRVHRSDGTNALVHYRFADALAEVAGLDGARVHRGAWVAASGLEGALRERRRWRLLLSGGRSVPVSASYLGDVRGRGWLRPILSAARPPEPQSAVAFHGSAL